jgi:hypothetical protein
MSNIRYSLSETALAAISQDLSAATPNYAAAYQAIAVDLAGKADSDTIAWFTQAALINNPADNSFIHNFVRDYSKYVAVTDGANVTNFAETFQNASNTLASNVLQDILATGSAPTFQTLGPEDTQNAATAFGGDPLSWAGYAEVAQVFNSVFQGTGDYLKSLSSEQTQLVQRASLAAGLEALVQSGTWPTFSDIGNGIYTFLSNLGLSYDRSTAFIATNQQNIIVDPSDGPVDVNTSEITVWLAADSQDGSNSNLPFSFSVQDNSGDIRIYGDWDQIFAQNNDEVFNLGGADWNGMPADAIFLPDPPETTGAVGTVDADRLYGTPGVDIFDGEGAPTGSQDVEIGNGGDDVFIYNPGYGALEIYEYGSSLSVLQFGAGTSIAQIKVAIDISGDLILTDGIAGDQIQLDYMRSNSKYGVQAVQFADGTKLTAAQLIALATNGTTNAAQLYGTSGADIFDGKGTPAGGQDVEIGNGGSDTFIYNLGYGELEIYEIAGSDSALQFGIGITAAQLKVTGDSNGDLIVTDGIAGDQIKLDYMLSEGNFGVQTVRFADGSNLTSTQLLALAMTSTTGADRIYGTLGINVFDGEGAPAGGQDVEIGNGASDTFIYNVGYGALEISESNASDSTLTFGAGITMAQIKVTSDSSGDLIITDGVGGDQIKLDYMLSYGNYGIQTMLFADGTSVAEAQLFALATNGTIGADQLYGTAGADVFDGKGALSGAWDIEVGNGGADRFMYNGGYGELEISEFNGTGSILQFGAGITAAQLKVVGDSNGDLIVTDGIAGDQVKLDYMLGYNNYGVQAVRFADNTGLTGAQLSALAMVSTADPNQLYGTISADVFDGKGAPVGGQDVEIGNGGGDTFLYKAGYGVLEIDEQDYGANADNVLQLGFGITETQVSVTSDGKNLFLADGTAGDLIELDSMASQIVDGIQTVTFLDGTVWTRAQLIDQISTATSIVGTAGADALNGSSGADDFDGRGAPAGSQDIETGNGGSDTFVFNARYGHLKIYENGSSADLSVLALGASITTAQIAVTSDGTNLFLGDGTAGDQIELQNYMSGSFYGPQSVRFADGTIWTAANLIALETTGTAGTDTIYGTTGIETFDGKGAPASGLDVETGDGGADTFVFNAGYGHLKIFENGNSADQSVLALGAGITAAQVGVTGDGTNLFLADGVVGDRVELEDYMVASSYGPQLVRFADGTIWTRAQLIARPITTNVTGTLGSDSLTGTSGAETFDGEGAPTGTQDMETGGGGGDTFVFNSGYGQLDIDEVGNSADKSVLALGFGITAAQVSVTSDGTNLYLTDGTNGDRIELQNYLVSANYGPQTLEFAGGTSWTRAQLISMSSVGIIGTTGADTLYGSTVAETFDGKGAPTGSQDFESGDGGADTFIFNAGYGHLEIYENGSSADHSVLALGAGIAAAQVAIDGDGTNLFLTDEVAGDRIELEGYMSASYYGPQSVRFADGTTWSRAQLLVLEATGTAGADTIYGSTGAETFDGKGAPAGSQDFESGDGGADTFIFNAGYGHLEIYENGSSADHSVLALGSGIAAAQVAITGDGTNLFLADGVAGDRIELEGYMSASYYGPQSVRFADGTTWSRAQLLALEATGTAGADTLYGTTGAETFDGRGAPTGSQDLESGDGGADTFVFDAGYGHLEIYENGSSADQSVLALGAGIAAAQVAITGDGTNLFLADGVAGDRIELEGYMSASYYGPQSVRLADGTTWSRAQLLALEATGTAGAETFDSTGAPPQDQESGDGGADTFALNAGYSSPLDGGLNQLVQVMAMYSSQNVGFDTATVSQVPGDIGLQNAVAAAWHH